MSTAFKITRGLDLPLAGEPSQEIVDGPDVRHVALIGDDYIGMRPTMLVQVGDAVKRGQAVFADKKTPGVQFTAPTSGRVVAINRGEKRRFESLVIEEEGDDAESFESFRDHHLHNLERKVVQQQLIASGLWTALRTRPYSKVPAPGTAPHSLFVTAIDTNPLAARPEVVLAEVAESFVFGLQVLSTLTEGPLYLCKQRGVQIPGEDEACVTVAEFEGAHPAGLVGTHIHKLEPVNQNKTVWHIGYQDVVAIGRLFVDGELNSERVVSLAGPVVKQPQLVRTKLGASLAEMTHDRLEGEDVRVISGSVLSGRQSVPPTDFLGRYHNQVSALAEGRHRELLGWLAPGGNKFSVKRVFASALAGASKRFAFTTSTEGSPRAIVPIGMFEKVMPLDLVITQMLKSLCVGDAEFCQTLGCLELDEEDLALCTYVCPGKNEYGPMLRQCLTTIEQEG